MLRLALLGLLLSVSGLSAADKNEDLAKAAVIDFAKAVKAKDIDAIMKVIDVPWIGPDIDSVIKETDELKKLLTEKLGGVKPDEVPTEVSKVEAWSEVQKKAVKESDKERVKKVDAILGKDGQIVTLGDDTKSTKILVAIKSGKAKIVGIVGKGGEK